jgi:hypothetical protein
MAAAPLPPALEARLAGLAARVHRLRAVAGASRLVVALVASAALLVSLDVAFRLPVAARCVLAAVWLVSAGWLGWVLLLRPWRDEVALDEVAARLERHYPQLGERLLTVVELRDGAGPANGSPHLVASLAREAEQQTRDLDLTTVAPARPVARLAAVAAVVLVAAGVAAAVVSGSGERLRRVGMPWHRPAPVSYRVLVSSGEPVVRRGDPVTLTAYVERTDPKAPLPDSAVLVIRDGPGQSERRLPMAGAAAAGFHVTRPSVTADFEYRVEVGPAASDWHAVLAADPVGLSHETNVEVTPPAYAAARFPPRVVPGLVEIDGLQHSAAVLRLKFTRPAEAVFLEWRPDGGTPESVPFQPDPDRAGGTAHFRLRQSGTLLIVLVNESGPRKLRTEVPVPVRVAADGPPRFEEVAGVTGRLRLVKPGDRVPFELAVTDDVAVAGAEVEYAVGDHGPPVRLPVPLAGLGTPRAAGRFTFDLTGKGAEGETVRVRVRATDARRVDDPKLGPQEAVYPASGWLELRLTSSAPPLDEQEIIGQRDALRSALTAAARDVRVAAALATQLEKDTAGRGPLAQDEATRLAVVREKVRLAAAALHDAGREAQLVRDLRPLASAAREVADRPIRAADDAFGPRRAGADNPADRAVAFAAAFAALKDAAARLDALAARNDRLARDRLDHRALAALVAGQSKLLDRLKGGDANLAGEQRELRDRLRRLLADSETLRLGATAAAYREARERVAVVTDLADQLRELNDAVRRLAADTRRGLLAGRAAEQRELSDRAAPVLDRAATAARLVGVKLPGAADLRAAADRLAAGDAVKALTDLERFAQALDRAAAEFDRWADERADPHLAARQLAKWQDDLRTRYAAATKDAAFAALPEAVRAAFRTEQQAIRTAAAGLRLPPGDLVGAARSVALGTLQVTADSLPDGGAVADQAQRAAADALSRLAEAIPPVGTRLARTRPALDALLVEQNSVAVAVDLVLRGTERLPLDAATFATLAERLAAAREKQQKVLDGCSALDLPGLEMRQVRAVTALRAAVADLAAGLPQDVPASQAWARRELDRLRQATDHAPTADEQADALARKQAEIATGVAALGADADKKRLAPFVADEQEVTRQLAAFAVPAEAPALLNDAREAVRLAESGFRDGAPPPELVRRTRVAADALAKLAARLNETETDAARLRRLARNRRHAADEAKKLVGRTFNPAASAEAKAALGWEADELAHTRVRAAGQPLKRKAAALYAELKAQAEPDRKPGPQNQLADLLDELVDGQPKPPPPAAKDGALVPERDDGFLPSGPQAAVLRDLAKEARAARVRVTDVAAELTRLLHPAGTDPLAALAARQRELASAIADLARKLVADRDVATAERATDAAEAAAIAADRLRAGDVSRAKAAAGNAAEHLNTVAAAADLLAKQQALVAELAVMSDPATAAARQKARQADLSVAATAAMERLDRATRDTDPTDPVVKKLAAVVAAARAARRALAEAAEKSPDGMTPEAEARRGEALEALAEAAEVLAAATPPAPAAEPDPAAAGAGAALRDAEAAMRRAADLLGPRGDRAAAEAAMTAALDALRRAEKVVGEHTHRDPR